MILEGKRALITGVANQRSLAWAIAKKLKSQGAEIGLVYGHPRLEKRVAPLAEELGASFVIPCDVSSDEQIGSLFSRVGEVWEDFQTLVHSIAFADLEELQSPFIQVSRKGYLEAVEISSYSLLALTKAALPFLEKGNSSILTLTNYGSERVVPGYHMMGVAKAALESTMRYLAADLGRSGIRVNAISAGPVKTLAAAAIPGFREKLELVEKKSPLGKNISAEDVGEMAAFLSSSTGKSITGSTFYVDSGVHVVGA